MQQPFYDPLKSYEENFTEGPFGEMVGGGVFKNEGKPRFEFLGQKVFSPFGIAAGALPNGKYIQAAFNKGFDICTYKTVRSGKYPCNPWPNVVPVDVKDRLTLQQAEAGVVKKDSYAQPLTITNSFGVPSRDPDFWQEDMKKAVEAAGLGQAVVGSFQGTPRGSSEDYIKDFSVCAKLVKETGAKILEVNLSCPNEGTAHLLCFDIERVKLVVEAIKNEIGNSPLIIKVAYYKDRAMLERLLDLVGKTVDGIAAINTIMSKIINSDGSPAFKDGRTHSGVCGAGIKWAGLEMTERLKKLREEKGLKFSIIGVGGVMNAGDYQDYLARGADAVMSVTGAMWNPFLAQEIKQTIND